MLSLIAAIGKNHELGMENKLPWSLPDDLKKFREVTKGHAVIMGRKTHESIGRVLPGRKNIIITRNASYASPECIVVTSLEEALKAAEGDAEIFVIGGGEIFRMALPLADRMYLTSVDADIPADAYFPEFDVSNWKITEETPHPADEKHAYPFVFRIYDRKKL